MAKPKPKSIKDLVPNPTGPLADRFRILYEESELFCEDVGLPKDLIITILKTDTDWAFILKVDALVDSAAKHILRHGLCIKLANKHLQNSILEDFVDALPMNGRTSLLKLLEAAGLPPEELGFIESTRLVRNAFAHNIEYAGLHIIDLIKMRQDRSRLIKYLSAIAAYDEAKLIADYEKDPAFLRFCMIDSTMRVLFYAYHLADKPNAQKKAKATVVASS
jgi:hypothetical protein